MKDVENLFVDTNVLVHAMVVESPWHERARSALKSAVEHGRRLWISRQVIREYAAVMSRPQSFSIPLPGTQLADRMDRDLWKGPSIQLGLWTRLAW